MSFILSLDLGTTAIKVALFNNKGDIVALSRKEYSLLTPKPQYVELEVEKYWDAFKEGLNEVMKKVKIDKKGIAAIGISAQGETLILIDKKRKPLRNAIVWLDNRAEIESDKLSKKFSDEDTYKITGQVKFVPTWPASKILWVRENEKDIFRNVYKFLLIEDYFIYRLTGKFVSEGSLLCSTMYWNINTKKWWDEILSYLCVSVEQLPEIMESGEPVDKILPEVATELGLSPNTLIATGALDQAAGAIGVGNIKPGIFSENTGAALAICATVSKPFFDPEMKMPCHYHGLPDTYMAHTFTSGGMVLKWFKDSFCQLESDTSILIGTDVYNLLDEEAQKVNPGCDGLIMLPHLSGAMAPEANPKAKGVFYGFDFSHTKPHFIRSIMEAIACIIKRNIETLEKLNIKVDEIYSLGGGARSDIWNRIKADLIGKPVITTENEEAASLGAAILAGKAANIFKNVSVAVSEMVSTKKKYQPDKENFNVYKKVYRNYIKLYEDLCELFSN